MDMNDGYYEHKDKKRLEAAQMSFMRSLCGVKSREKDLRFSRR
jgi:hypothetical protein